MGKDPACHSQTLCGQHTDNIDQYLIVFIKTAPGSIPMYRDAQVPRRPWMTESGPPPPPINTGRGAPKGVPRFVFLSAVWMRARIVFDNVQMSREACMPGVPPAVSAK